MATYGFNNFDVLLNEFGVLLNEMEMAGILGLLLVLYLGIFAFGILTYVLESIGMYTIAKRRGLNAPGLAWVPLGNLWILGLIGDKDMQMRNGKDSKLRAWLLGLSLVTLAPLAAIFVIAFIMGMNAAFLKTGMSTENSVMALLLILLVVYFVIMVLSIVLAVLQYVALYRLYRSCRPENAAVYLVLGIFFGFLTPFFIFACRKYDAPSVENQFVPTAQAVQ